MNKIEVTVLTPTYNRGHIISNLYESLKKQTVKDFQWLVVDDGSVDNTQDVFSEILRQKATFEVEYFHKENGGKHTALNYSHDYIKGDWCIIVDSDDILTPDAIEKIISFKEKYEDREDIGVFSFLKADKQGKPLSNNIFDDKTFLSSYVDYRINKKIKGDQCEVIRTDVFKSYIFPTFKGENFVPESYLWMHVALDGYKTLYINDAIYIGEYLAGGLTKSGRKFRINNPQGMLADCNCYMNNRVSFFIRVKEMILIWVYGTKLGLKVRDVLKMNNMSMFVKILTLPVGKALFYKWSK